MIQRYETKEQEKSPIGCLLRLFWTAAGHIGLFYCAVHMVLRNPGWNFYLMDAVYAGLALALLAARFAYAVRYEGPSAGLNADALAGFSNYAWKLLLFAVMGWLATRGIGWLAGTIFN